MRIQRLQTTLGLKGISAFIAYAKGSGESSGAIRYLAGWMPPTSEVAFVIPTVGKPVLISNDTNRARAFRLRMGDEADVFDTVVLISTLSDVMHRLITPGSVLAFAGESEMTVARAKELTNALRGYEVQAGDALLFEQRAERTSFEAGKQLDATRVADAMVSHAMQIACAPNVTGAEIMAEVEYIGRRLGADRATCWLAIANRPAETYFELFELVTAFGHNARVQIGTTVLLDGYFSQVLRVGVFEEPSSQLLEAAAALIEMQDAALAAMIPGTAVYEIGDALEVGIDNYCPYSREGDPFRFQSCHAMGNSYSEPWSSPYLDADRNRSLDELSPIISPNQVYEIHPNFTLPELGHICAGDVALVTSSGGSWLSETERGILRLA